MDNPNSFSAVNIRMKSRMLLIPTVLALAGCASSKPFENNGVSVRRRAADLLVHNATQLDLAITAFDADAIPADVSPACIPPTADCLKLSAGGDLTVPYSDVRGNDGSGDIIVYAWGIASGATAYRWQEEARIVVGRP